jgi:predicted transcriptional regulator
VKIVGRHLAPFLASLEPGTGEQLRAAPGAVAVDVPLDDAVLARMAPVAPVVGGDPDELCAGDVCSAPLLVDPDDTVADVAETLLAHEREAAVVVEDDELVGIVTATNLVEAVAARIPCSDTSVREWMTVEPVAVDALASLAEAALLMRQRDVSRLVVVDDGRPVGTLTRAQLARRGVPAAAGIGF